MAQYKGFVGPSYTSQSRIAAYDRTVNLFPERIESGTGKATYVLYPTPGFTTYCTLADTPGRGLFTLNGARFAVGGGTLYQLPSTLGGSPTVRATGLNNPDDGPVTFAGNGDAGFQLLIGSGSKKYSFDLLTDTLTEQTAPATQVGFIDGYGIALDSSRSEISISDLEDFSSWDALDVAQRNDAPDKWLAMAVAHKEVWLFGSQTTAVWYNTGDAAFPFAPNPSVFIPHGIAAPWSACVLNGSPIWLGSGADGSGIVYKAQGYNPERVSTHAVEYAFSQYSAIADAEAFAYQENGHHFYVLTFPTAGATWVFDATNGLWHERGDWDGIAFTSLPIRGHLYDNGVHLTLDRTTGAVYQMSTTLSTTTAGIGIRRLRRAPHLAQEGAWLGFDRFQLDLEVGLGLASGQGSDPVVNLSWSDDGGQTFSAERSVSAGRVGEFKTRAVWHRLGRSEDRIFQVTASDPVPSRWIDAYLDVRAGKAG